MVRPLCFTSPEQFAAWQRLIAECDPEEALRGDYCTDCTPEYQQRMIDEGRCAHPETTFVKDADGFITGVRS